MKNRSRIHPAAEPHAQGNVGNEVLTNSLLHQRIEFFLRGFQRVGMRDAEGQRPIGTGGNLAIAPLEPPSRRELFDALDKRPWGGNVIQREVAIESFEAEPPVDFWVNEERLQLRAKKQIFVLPCDVQRLDSHAVAGKDNALSRLAPQGDSEHAPKSRETAFVPFEEGAQHGFRVGMRFEVMPQALQFGAQFEVVINLSVENDSAVAVLGKDGLIALLQIDDFQARRAQGKECRMKNSLLIRAAVNQRSRGLTDSFRRRAPVFSGESGDSAQCPALLRARRLSRAMPLGIFKKCAPRSLSGVTAGPQCKSRSFVLGLACARVVAGSRQHKSVNRTDERMHERAYTVPHDLHADAEQKKRGEPQDDAHAAFSNRCSETISKAITNINARCYHSGGDERRKHGAQIGPQVAR